MNNFSKAVIGTCIVRSAASMVDDNAYRVVLNNSRATIANHMIEAAKFQKVALDENSQPVENTPALLEAHAKLAAVKGECVTSTEQ